MQIMIYALFASVFCLPYLGKLELVPRLATLFPEILAGVMLVLVVGRAAAQRSLMMDARYAILFIVLALTIALGAVLNTVSAGVLVAGIRNYFKFFPLFLVPAVYYFSTTQMLRQLTVLLAFCLLQLPMSVVQKYYFSSHGFFTGDVVTGSLGGSGMLTVLLVSAISVLTGFFLTGRVGIRRYLLLMACLFLPTTINETKVTLVLLPLALVWPVIAGGAEVWRRKSRAISSVLSVGVLITIFIPIYDALILERRPEGITEFLATEGRVQGYLESTGRAGQVEAVVEKLAHDPTKLFLGLGIGNVSESFLGEAYTGAYFRRYGGYVKTSASQWLWEIGIVGAAVMVVFGFLVFSDAMRLRRAEGVYASFAIGWSGVMVIMFVSLFYNRALFAEELGYFFWYFSGLIAATTMRVRLASLQQGFDRGGSGLG